MRKFLVLIGLAAAFAFFLFSKEEAHDGLILAEAPGFGDLDPAYFDEEKKAQREAADATMAPITGRVVHVSGEAVVGARVVLEHAWVPEVSAVTDDDGAFELTPSERRGDLVVRGGGRILVGGERSLTDSKSDGYLLVLADPVTVRGKVVDPAGQVVAGAKLHARPPSDAMVRFGIAALPLESETQLGFTGDDGTFALGPLPNVPRSHIEIRHQEFETARVPFPADPSKEILVVLDPG